MTLTLESLTANGCLLMSLPVELLEVAGNDGDGQGHHQHPADGTQAPHQLIKSHGIDNPITLAYDYKCVINCGHSSFLL